MAINLSNYLNAGTGVNQTINGVGSTTQTGSTSNTTSTVSAGNLMLQNMLAGETFTGLVLGVKDNQVSIALGNGASLTATLANNVQIQSGQNITFIVEENQNNYISLKPMAATEQQAILINKALEGAGLPATSDNISIVKELLSLNMPISADTINEMIHQAVNNPDTEYHTLANLLRLDIPVTQENIAQYEAYTHFENNMSDKLAGIGQTMVDGLLEALNQNQEGLSFETAGQLIHTLYEAGGTEMKSMPMSDLFNNSQLEQIAEAMEQAGKDTFSESMLNSLRDGSTTVKQFVLNVLQLGQNSENINDSLKKLLSSDTMRESMHQIINETMKLIPEDVRENNAIPEYYSRMKKTLEEAEKLLSKAGTGTEVQKELTQVKTNIDFMNDLNKNMTFFQMPVKFSQSEGNGELYVFTNKRALNQNSDNVSALLHLDMENLGPMDVYVKLAGKSVSTNFCLESEDMLDFVYAHIEKLNARLEKLGYSTHFEMNVSKQTENGFDFEKDFIEKDVKEITSGQYIFDSRI